MKTLTFISIIVLILFAGCAKDEMLDENPELKKAKIPVPLKVEFCMTPDGTFIPVEGLPEGNFIAAGGNISGWASHHGKVDAEKSWMQTTRCYFNMEMFLIVMENIGEIYAANGDSYLFESVSYVNPMNKNFTGTVLLKEGSGRFEGIHGSVEMTGGVDIQTMQSCWSAIGSIWYK